MAEDFEIVRGGIDYSSSALSAFDYLMAHARAAGFVLVPRLSEVRSIELQWSDKRRNPFSAQTRPDHVNFYLRGPILSRHPQLFERAVERFGPVKPNGRGEYRLNLHNVREAEAILMFLRENEAWPSKRTDRRFVASTFEPVRAGHFLHAARQLSNGFISHPFGPSTDYDLLFNEHRLPPKAVFGLAASEALGFRVGPENFSGGEGTLCFRMLRANGYEIVQKGEDAHLSTPLISDEERVWTEGRPQLVAHLRRERGTGLAAAKRDQFRALHGGLFCERCALDPVAVFGSILGEACIEVHHREKPVADMASGHQTRLEDLQCLCANCHRVTHRELREADLR